MYYTDSGVYSLAAYEATFPQFTGLSIHALSGALWLQQLLFAVAGVLAVALVVGYRTRTVGALSFLLLLSLHARNPAVNNGGDILLRTVFLLALLTPLGERWSIDALRRGSARRTVRSAATTALLAQPLVVFGQNAVLKHRGETWYAGRGLDIAFANDVMTVYLGDYLTAFPLLLETLNWLWVTLLAGAPVLLLFTAGWTRAVIAFVYIGAFLGMVPTLMVGLFPLVLTTMVLAYLQPPFWDAIGRLLVPHLGEYRPTTAHLGRFANPPVERRLLGRLRERGYGTLVESITAYGRSLLTVLGVIALVFVLVYGIGHVIEYDVPYNEAATAVIDQSWGLYAPNPTDSYHWYVVTAELRTGESVSALDTSGVSFDRPPDPSSTFDSFRERKYMSVLASTDADGPLATDYAEWACNRAATIHEQPVRQVTVSQLTQPSPVDGTYEEPSRDSLFAHQCG